MVYLDSINNNEQEQNNDEKRHNEILQIIKNEPSSIPDIQKKLTNRGLGISRSLLKRDYIQKMIEKRVIGNIEKNQDSKER